MVSLLGSAKLASLILVGASAILLGAAPQPLSRAEGDALVGGTVKGCRNLNTQCVPNTYNCAEVLSDCDRRDPIINGMQCVAQEAKGCGGIFCGSPRSTRKCQ